MGWAVDAVKEAYKRWKKDAELYSSRRQKKLEGIPSGLRLRPVERKRDRLMRKRDVYGRPPKRYSI